ncbi:S49 family peptidase [Plastorhodobacter daqingensis]|uniref:S49 family peptidase n=1 Tax=Plastorhodobacter daqingensis TaxID=1387281 RepID=A0ABW2URR6_9RHOB
MKRFIPFLKTPPRVALVRLSGTIASGGRPGSALNDAAVAPLIERAFRRGKPDAVALVINSPGGAPVQTALIAGRIRRLAEERKVKVHAFVEDVAASGGYWLATAADDIWIDESSIVGSIGVVSAGFGFHGLIERFGVERRVHTAGRSKSFMDPFRPEKTEDVARLKSMMEPIHQAFIDQVRARRGERLSKDTDLFTGDIWVGRQAVSVGLADGIGHPLPKLKELYGPKVEVMPYGMRRPILSRLGMRAAGGVMDLAEDRALWARYGL